MLTGEARTKINQIELTRFIEMISQYSEEALNEHDQECPNICDQSCIGCGKELLVTHLTKYVAMMNKS
jgi:hypothetical protein